ncbi:transposase [Streptomyces sp. RP5T]|uniref:transposase n=1 Tax=Streptomyces sp. RP5T TaxID=2490848 RepID=UPI0021ADEDE8|nr:transposase [Streptomyces sp. RP5T]
MPGRARPGPGDRQTQRRHAWLRGPAKRWIVERRFAHLMRTRRLARDFERRTTSAEAMIYWSMTLLMTRRLARSPRGRA